MSAAIPEPTTSDLAERVRSLLATRDDVTESRLVGGGRGFMVAGHLCCGASGRGLTVRVGADAMADAVAHDDVEPLRLGGRATAAFVVVAASAVASDDDLARWVGRGLALVATLPRRSD